MLAAHTKDELREAARVLGRAALRCGFRPGAGLPVAATRPAEPVMRPFDGDAMLPRAA